MFINPFTFKKLKTNFKIALFILTGFGFLSFINLSVIVNANQNYYAKIDTPVLTPFPGLVINSFYFLGGNAGNPDWVELFYDSEEVLSLNGFYLEDVLCQSTIDPANCPNVKKLDGLKIGGENKYLKITWGKILNNNADLEFIKLFSADKELVDQVRYGNSQNLVSGSFIGTAEDLKNNPIITRELIIQNQNNSEEDEDQTSEDLPVEPDIPEDSETEEEKENSQDVQDGVKDNEQGEGSGNSGENTDDTVVPSPTEPPITEEEGDDDSNSETVDDENNGITNENNTDNQDLENETTQETDNLNENYIKNIYIKKTDPISCNQPLDVKLALNKNIDLINIKVASFERDFINTKDLDQYEIINYFSGFEKIPNGKNDIVLTAYLENQSIYQTKFDLSFNFDDCYKTQSKSKNKNTMNLLVRTGGFYTNESSKF
jgi:hypothetical protein